MAALAAMLHGALRKHQAGALDEARELYCRVLEADPGQTDALHLLGLLANQVGQQALARQFIENALARAPHNAEYHNSLGVVLLEMKQPAQALASFRRALELAPRHVLALMNMGNAWQDLNDTQSSIACYEQALTLQPEHAESLNNLGRAYLHLGRLDLAADAYRRALAVQPGQVESLTNLGSVLHHQGFLDESLGCYQAALRLRPDLAALHNNLGNVQRDQGLVGRALESYEQALQLRPDYALAHNNLGLTLTFQGKLSEGLACYRKALEFNPQFLDAQSNLLFALNYDQSIEPATLFAEHRAWGERAEQTAPLPRPHDNDPGPDRRLRIGYVSPDLREHALLRFFEPVLANHDAHSVQIHCYAEVPVPDSATARLRSHVHGWRSTCGVSDARLAEWIREDGIDILVDLAGHTARNRLMAFTYRPAPVQATYLGYPNTTGLTCIDYLLSDEVFFPADRPALATEKIIRLPRGVSCFACPASAPAVGPLPAGAAGRLTFGSLHNVAKLNADVIGLWSEVLRSVPNSRLLLFRDTLKGELAERIRGGFVDRGIAPERLLLRHDSPAEGYLAVYNEIDVSLDVFPWGGGTTTYESLWMGVPVLTLIGPRLAERGSASVLTRLALTEWIADSPGDYAARAARHAADWAELSRVRGQLRSLMKSTVGDAVRFTRSLEDAYRTMWRSWCEQSRQHRFPRTPAHQIS
jgi:protein O-GlcNAc transferase